jgi:putative acetyltransferase
MSVTVAIETPNQPEVLGLIAASDVYMNALYPPEGNFAVDIDALCNPDIAFVVARLHGKAAGCGAIKWYGDGTAELKRIFVADDARGNGIGRRIMDQLQGLADERRVGRLYLETGPLNVEAVQLYRALGFEECGPFADYPENPYSLFMTKRLANA